MFLDLFQPEAETNNHCPFILLDSEDSEDGNSDNMFLNPSSNQYDGFDLNWFISSHQKPARRSSRPPTGTSCPS